MISVLNLYIKFSIVPIVLDAKKFQSDKIHSVGDRNWKNFEVFDTETTIGEVWQLNILLNKSLARILSPLPALYMYETFYFKA